MRCTFCQIYQEGRGVVYENKFFFSQFDKFPVSPGHIEVVPKRHIASLFELTEEEWVELMPALADTIGVIEQTDLRKRYHLFITNPINEKSVEFCRKMLSHIRLGKKPDAYNIGINEGEAAGRTIDHLHIHIIPRFSGDVKDYIGGIRHIIPGMGNYRR